MRALRGFAFASGRRRGWHLVGGCCARIGCAKNYTYHAFISYTCIMRVDTVYNMTFGGELVMVRPTRKRGRCATRRRARLRCDAGRPENEMRDGERKKKKYITSIFPNCFVRPDNVYFLSGRKYIVARLKKIIFEKSETRLYKYNTTISPERVSDGT